MDPRGFRRFTHDAVRVGDTVWVCNTGAGQLIKLALPAMKVVQTYDLFTLREHINTLAVLDDASVWVVLHNLGQVCIEALALPARHQDRAVPAVAPISLQQSVNSQVGETDGSSSHLCSQSQLAQVDLATGTVSRRIRNVGNNVHGLVAWRGQFVMLSSKDTALVVLDIESGRTQVLWQVRNSCAGGAFSQSRQASATLTHEHRRLCQEHGE